MTWKAAFPVMSIKMRQIKGTSDFQPRRELFRRADTGSSMLSTVSVPVPTSFIETSSASIPIATQILNEGLKVPDTPFNTGCNNCTTTGTVDVEYMDFDIDCQTEEFEDGFDTHDCIQGGGASIELNGFWAHMDLYTNLSQNWDFETSIYRMPLNYSLKVSNKVTLPLALLIKYLKLLGVGSASLVWEPLLIGGYQLNGSVEIDYGFELTVPDGTGLLFNLSDPDKSTQSKFTDGWNITALPFNASAAVDAITITLGLRNALGMHFHFDTNLLPDVTAGAYLDFPVISTKITPLHSGVDADCQPLASSSAADKDVAERVLTDVYHVEPSAVVDVGFYGEILHQDGTLSVYNNTDDPWPLPTACLNFDADAGTYSAAAAVVKAATGAGRRAADPFSAQQFAVGVLCLAAAFMLV
ncbi:hypothetical protein SLS56_007665 [Neofusicoccum ribis]|uniref:Peptidase A1 domain-containing protein n=1 Tax=Neofusicoccum ribis TaxID=45134 RepID=A0ABR3SNZ7_9PEZI